MIYFLNFPPSEASFSQVEILPTLQYIPFTAVQLTQLACPAKEHQLHGAVFLNS